MSFPPAKQPTVRKGGAFPPMNPKPKSPLADAMRRKKSQKDQEAEDCATEGGGYSKMHGIGT